MTSQCRQEARRVLGNGDEVEDVVQEALMRAWRYRDSCRSSAARGAWIRQITRHEAYRLLSRVRHGEPLDEEMADVPTGQSDADNIVRRIVVRSAIARLPPEDQVLALLRYDADLEHPRIAGLLGIPEGTVKVRLHRIRKRLKPELASIV
jgi:RNA polymerase sigma-70 factor (ECF subfamily)